MSEEICIAGRPIGPEHPPYVIAEISANHQSSLDTAMALVAAAKNAGADAVKLQTYRADTITLDCDSEDFQIPEGLWRGQTLFQLYRSTQMPWSWHAPLFENARKLGITIFSTPFDYTAVDLLEKLNAPAYKIASLEVVDLPLIRYVAATGKPLILSTGMASREEVHEAIETARSAGGKNPIILRCVTSYPAPAEDYNLRTIPDMMRRYGVVVGLSDHTLDNTTAIASVALGACLIEKHFTLDRAGGGADDSFSLEPSELADLCRAVRIAWEALGNVSYGPKTSEQQSVRFRRSLYFVKDLNAGDLITPDAVRSVRPGFGLPPKYLDYVLGAKILRSVKRNTPVLPGTFEKESQPRN